jgi:hypothetical protein
MYIKKILHRHEAEELGLQEMEVGPGMRLSTPTSPDRGRGQADGGVAVDVFSSGATDAAKTLARWAREVIGTTPDDEIEPVSAGDIGDVEPVNAVPAMEAGLSLFRSQEKPFVFYVTSGKQIRAVHRGPSGFIDRVSEYVMRVDTGIHRGPVVIMQPDQTGIVMRRTCVQARESEESTQEHLSAEEESDVWVGPVFRRPLTLPVEVEIESDAEKWANEYLDSTGDEWLVDLVKGKLLTKDTLDHVIGIGILVRLQIPPSGQELKNEIEEMFRGELKRTRQRELEWARHLSRDEVSTVERFAVAEAGILDEELERLFYSAAVDEKEWQDEMLKVLHLRDDLEGVSFLLREAGSGYALRGILESIDEQGRLYIKSLPTWRGPPTDERLQRAAVVNPEGWWIWPTDWDFKELPK